MDLLTPPGPGLSPAEVASRQAAGLCNETDQVTSRPLRDIIRANVFTRFNALLGALCVLVLLSGHYRQALFGIPVVVNAVLGIGQEWYAKRKLDSLAVLHAPTARICRDGRTLAIPTSQVVQGDLIFLGLGDQVPADGPLLAADHLEIDESNLTGESDAITKQAGDEVTSGTAVVAGSGWFTAAKVGAQAVAQQLSSEARVFVRAYSEVQHSTNVLLRWLTWVVLLLAPLSVWSQWRAARQEGWRDVALHAITPLTGLIPEGLVVLTTLAFLMAALQLTRQQALVQELPAIEGLARVDVICADKTGTLTEGEIGFDAISYLGSIEDGGPIDGISQYHLDTTDGTPPPGPAEIQAALGALVHESQPNATARALAEQFPAPAGEDWQVIDRVAFSSQRKYSAATTAGHGQWVLGAPDILLDTAGGIPTQVGLTSEAQNTPTPAEGGERGRSLSAPGLTSEARNPCLAEQVLELSRQGRRLVVLCQVPADAPPITNSVKADLTDSRLIPRALIELSEKLRTDAAQTIDFFRKQGVGVKVISGDNPVTVAAVARRAGLTVGQAVDARQLPEDPAELAHLVDDITVFGRVSPSQKKAIVQALQANGHNVAMTGDGVNDVLALKAADVGIAMGNAAQATKAVAQLVLLDSRFSHLPKVLAEGRRLIANVERVASLFVAKNAMSAVALITTAILGITFPFLPLHFTIVSTFTIGLPAMILALAANHRRYVPGFLYRVLGLALPAGIAAGLAAFLAFSLADGTPVQQSTQALATLLIVNFWLLGALSRPYKWWKALVVALMVAAVLTIFLWPVTQRFFALASLDGAALFEVVLVGAGCAILVEAAYQVSRSLTRDHFHYGDQAESD